VFPKRLYFLQSIFLKPFSKYIFVIHLFLLDLVLHNHGLFPFDDFIVSRDIVLDNSFVQPVNLNTMVQEEFIVNFSLLDEYLEFIRGATLHFLNFHFILLKLEVNIL
jgi:hypothetical protein